MRDLDKVIRGNIVRADQVVEGGYVAISGETIEALRVGSDADITIFEPGEHVIDPSTCRLHP